MIIQLLSQNMNDFKIPFANNFAAYRNFRHRCCRFVRLY